MFNIPSQIVSKIKIIFTKVQKLAVDLAELSSLTPLLI